MAMESGELYQLPADGSEGSRELLLALSWLFHRINLLEQLLNKTRLRGDETTLCVGGTPLVEGSLGTLGSVVRKWGWCQVPGVAAGTAAFPLEGAPRSSGREGYTAIQDSYLYQRMSQQPLNQPSFCSRNQFDQIPRQQSRMLMLLECEITLLESYLEWKQLEPLYWHWMESVLDAKLADDSQEVLNANTVAMASGIKRKDKDSCQRNQSMKREMDQLGKELLELKWGLQGEASAKRASWCKRVEHKEQDMDPQEFGAIALKLHDRVGQKLSALRCNNVKPATNTTYRLLLRETTKQKTLPVHAGETEASQVIKELKEMESDLLSELTKLRSDCKDEMLEMMAGVDGMICIPPLKR